MKSTNSRIVGAELLRKVESLSEAANGVKARECGYVRTGTDGKQTIEFSAFYRALAEAAGVKLEAEHRSAGRPPLRYKASVLTTGAILVGPRYVEQLGLGPGDRIRLAVSGDSIELRRDPNRI